MILMGMEILYMNQKMLVKKYNIMHNEQITIYDINLSYFKKIGYTEIEKESLLKDLAFLVVEDKSLLEKLYRGDKIMDSVQRKMEGLMEEVDGILYYDEVKLQQCIEKEMCEKGLAEGRKEGRAEGEQRKALETAKKLLDLKVNTLEQIAHVTGLTVKEIKDLEDSIINN